MESAKETMIEIIRRQPEASTFEELFRELLFARMIRRGLEDSQAGRTCSEEDLKKTIESWQE